MTAQQTNRFHGWIPSARDTFEQWLTNRMLEHDAPYIARAAWSDWLDRQWREWRDMEKELGLRTKQRGKTK